MTWASYRKKTDELLLEGWYTKDKTLSTQLELADWLKFLV